VRRRPALSSHRPSLPVRAASTLGACLALTAAFAAPAAAQDTLRFEPTVGHTTFDVREPVATITPGTVIISRTMHGDYYEPGGGAFPGEVGPFYVEGATTNDMLRVEIIRVQPNHDLAGVQIYPDFGGLATDVRVRLLNDPIPARRWEWRLDRDAMTGTVELPESEMSEITIELRPMLGRVAVAPANGEAFAGLWPGNFGGNMDVPEVREGAVVYLPVLNDGAYFYFGDGHARQGEGEVNGTGLETSMDVTLKVDLVRGRTIEWPRLEDATHIMVAGSARPLIDAFRLAHVELVEWLVEEYGFGKWDAYMLVGQLGETTIGNIVDPIYTVVAKFPKEHLPR
jgi:amidase